MSEGVSHFVSYEMRHSKSLNAIQRSTELRVICVKWGGEEG